MAPFYRQCRLTRCRLLKGYRKGLRLKWPKVFQLPSTSVFFFPWPPSRLVPRRGAAKRRSAASPAPRGGRRCALRRLRCGSASRSWTSSARPRRTAGDVLGGRGGFARRRRDAKPRKHRGILSEVTSENNYTHTHLYAMHICIHMCETHKHICIL